MKSKVKQAMVAIITMTLCFIVTQPVLAGEYQNTAGDYSISIRKELTMVVEDEYSFEAATDAVEDVTFYCNDEIPDDYEGTTDGWSGKGYFDGQKFIAQKAGKITVWAEVSVPVYSGDDNRSYFTNIVTIRDYCVVTILPTKMEDKLMIGNEVNLDYTNHELYQKGTYTVVTESSHEEGNNKKDNVVTVDDNGVVTAIGKGYAEIYLTYKVDKDNARKIKVAAITVLEGGFDAAKLVRAVGSQAKTLGLNNVGGKFIIWTTDDVGVANVDANGLMTPVKEGTTTIYANVQTVSGKVVPLSCTVTVTNPKLNKKELNLAKGLNYQLLLTGIVEDSQFQWTTSNDGIVSMWGNGNIYTKTTGNATIKVSVDGITISCTVRVTNPKLKNSELLLVKGSGKTLTLKGTNSYSKPKWSSSDKTIAKVNKKGKVTTKNVGNATITCEVDGTSFSCRISIGKKKAVQAVKAAEGVVGAKYSQARRMQKGYYDCSSLVWRSYRQYGVYFGNRYYAPTAAEIARNMVRNKKSVSLKTIKNPNKLLPGDLLFYTRKPKNGRYKNIYHVAMYCGNGKIVHADGKKVSRVPYWIRKDTVVVARPVK